MNEYMMNCATCGTFVEWPNACPKCRPPAPASGSDVVDLGATDDLWTWFGLSYASFLVLPRVLMHEMPVEWQRQMAKLLWEYQDAFPNQPDITTSVQARKDGRLIKMPEWLCDYRRPDENQIAKLRQTS